MLREKCDRCGDSADDEKRDHSGALPKNPLPLVFVSNGTDISGELTSEVEKAPEGATVAVACVALTDACSCAIGESAAACLCQSQAKSPATPIARIVYKIACVEFLAIEEISDRSRGIDSQGGRHVRGPGGTLRNSGPLVAHVQNRIARRVHSRAAARDQLELRAQRA